MTEPILEALALGQMELYLPKPVWSPDEQFHRAITESLDEWWREQGGRFEAVTVIGEEPSVRTHEIRDILARNSVPFGFYRSDSAEGCQALARLDVDQPAGPAVALPGGPTSRHGRSARTSSTATRPPRWPPGKTCTWWA